MAKGKAISCSKSHLITAHFTTTHSSKSMFAGNQFFGGNIAIRNSICYVDDRRNSSG